MISIVNGKVHRPQLTEDEINEVFRTVHEVNSATIVEVMTFFKALYKKEHELQSENNYSPSYKYFLIHNEKVQQIVAEKISDEEIDEIIKYGDFRITRVFYFFIKKYAPINLVKHVQKRLLDFPIEKTKINKLGLKILNDEVERDISKREEHEKTKLKRKEKLIRKKKKDIITLAVLGILYFSLITPLFLLLKESFASAIAVIGGIAYVILFIFKIEDISFANRELNGHL